MKVSYVGILLNQSMYRGITTGRTETEVLAFYEEGARMYGLKPCYIRLDDLRAHQATVPAFVKKGNGYRRVRIPVPRIIHNRALLFSTREKEKLNRIAEARFIVFNRWNRYSKLYIHSLLWADPEIRPHLAYTVSGTAENVRLMMKSYNTLFIKPNSGSIGAGIMRITRTDKGWKFSYAVRVKGRKRWKSILFTDTLPGHLLKKLTARKYHIQEALSLATYRGNPFDLRVSVQKDASGDWQVTGMVGKVAPAGRFLSNVGQGGKVHKLAELLDEYPNLKAKVVERDIGEFALRVVRRLEESIPGLADVGLDIGLTKEGLPLFIECNGRDQRYAFRNVRMLKEWKATYANPMGYAKYLLDKLKTKG